MTNAKVHQGFGNDKKLKSIDLCNPTFFLFVLAFLSKYKLHKFS